MTTIPRWTVATPDFKNLQSQLNRIFEPFARINTDEDLATGSWVPPVDVAETQEKILVRAELPGMTQQGIAIEFENGILTIKGGRQLEKNGDGMTWHRVERTYGNFVRSFTLPRTVDPERIAATYRDGVLEVEVPEKEEAKPKQIRIAVQWLFALRGSRIGSRSAIRASARLLPVHSKDLVPQNDRRGEDRSLGVDQRERVRGTSADNLCRLRIQRRGSFVEVDPGEVRQRRKPAGESGTLDHPFGAVPAQPDALRRLDVERRHLRGALVSDCHRRLDERWPRQDVAEHDVARRHGDVGDLVRGARIPLPPRIQRRRSVQEVGFGAGLQDVVRSRAVDADPLRGIGASLHAAGAMHVRNGPERLNPRELCA